MRLWVLKLLLVTMVITLGSANLFADNVELLSNPNFNSGSTTAVTAGSNPGLSAASGWRVWSDVAGTTFTSQLLESNAPGGSGNMLYVSTSNYSSGIYQMFPMIDAPNGVIASVWINVISGYVGMAIVGASTNYTWASTGTGWQQLTFTGTGPVNEIAIYNWSSGGASFYLENASVVDPPARPTPEPASLLMLGTGLGALAARFRSKARSSK
jgi:hypothetical protein